MNAGATRIPGSFRCQTCEHSYGTYDTEEGHPVWHCMLSQLGESTCKLRVREPGSDDDL